ncbi:MAG: IS1634 family transposase [Dehalococcoidia bacterium]
MIETLGDVEFETRVVGPLVLTTPFLRRLGLARIVDKHCSIAEQADMGHGVVAELVVQCRLTEPQALYDMPDWAERYGLVALHPDLEKADQVNDDRIGRMLDAIYDRRGVIWGELIGQAAREYGIDLSRLHADTTAIKFAGLFPDQPEDETVPRLEPGYNPQGEWVQQLKLFALAAGDSGLPLWFDALSGGEGDSSSYVPQVEAFCQHAQLARLLPLDQVIVLGDRKMPTEENQLAWLRLGVGYIGPVTMQDHHRQTLQELLDAGQRWTELPYVAQRDTGKEAEQRTIYRGVGHTVTLTDPDSGDEYPVRHLYIHSSALAKREAKRRQDEMAAIEAEIQRIQGLVNKYDYKTPEIITRRVQQKAFKNRPAQRYFDFQVVGHLDQPEGPFELLYTVDHEKAMQDTELDGVYLLVAGGTAVALDDASLLQEWKGQYKVEHCFRLINQLFLVGPIFLKNPRRIVSLIFLIMVGCLVAGLIERQVRRVLAERQEPIHGLMPEGRDHLRPTVRRILKAFAHYSVVYARSANRNLVSSQFAKLNCVQQQILKVLRLPAPAELFGQPATA